MLSNRQFLVFKEEEEMPIMSLLLSAFQKRVKPEEINKFKRKTILIMNQTRINVLIRR